MLPSPRKGAQTVKKVLQMAKVIRRLQDSHRIDRLCRLGGEFSVVKFYFTEENIHQPSSKKCLQHFFETLRGRHALYSSSFDTPCSLAQRITAPATAGATRLSKAPGMI